MERVIKTDAEGQLELTPIEYQETRQAATEQSGKGEYVYHNEAGIYTCMCCNTPLFESETKFDAACGWSSYFKCIYPVHVKELMDTHLAWCVQK